MPQSRPQKVNRKQNGGSLKFKTFDFQTTTILLWINLLKFGFRCCAPLKKTYKLIPNSTYAAFKNFLLTPNGSTLTVWRICLRSVIGRIWHQNVGLFKWNATPETKSQKVYSKQNCRGLKIKGFKLLTVVVLF
jgi:hypothetical protein